jgi:DNA-binding HxlR family transcriptional regulator
VFIYQQKNISDAIAAAILKSKKENKKDRIHYREIRRRVEDILGHTISDRKLLKHLSIMDEEEILHKEDPTRKRGSRVYYELTDKGKRQYRLRILGQEQVEKRRGLYQLLIFFEVFKGMNLMSERRLLWFLRQIGASKQDLVEVVYFLNLSANSCV